ncbi:hypothetical protein A9Q96_05490 [Rhodobacterales bacterium 52_120_T64]|nr:hypothetical protein A9Q96_05490 [Rhodobacterales bacterium 52_120_T64]
MGDKMFRIIRAGLAFCLAGGAAYAGSVAMVAPVEMEMVAEETGSMGGSGMWLIPLLAIALIALAVNNNDNGSPGN